MCLDWGIPESSFGGYASYKIKNGKVAEHWTYYEPEGLPTYFDPEETAKKLAMLGNPPYIRFKDPRDPYPEFIAINPDKPLASFPFNYDEYPENMQETLDWLKSQM